LILGPADRYRKLRAASAIEAELEQRQVQLSRGGTLTAGATAQRCLLFGFFRLKGDDNSRSVASWNAALPSKSPISPLPSSSLTDTERAGLFHTQPNLQCRLSAFIGVCNVADGVIE
jgi:hypothetical protein